MGNCLVTKLSEVVSDQTLEKLGELRLKVVRNDTSSQIATIRFGAATSGVKITIISGGYFCKSQTDSTPINTSIDDSKEIDVYSTQSVHGKYVGYLYFQSDEIVLLINDKYNFLGIDTSPLEGNYFKYYVKYDLDSVKYLSNWVRFSSSIREKISVQDIPSKTILSTRYGTDGNFDGISIGLVDNYNNNIHRGLCIEKDVIGTISSINCSCNLTGTFTFNLANRIVPLDGLELYSPNVYGDITKNLGSIVSLGNKNMYLNVTCNNPLSKTPAVTRFNLYSSVFTLPMLKNLINVAGKVNVTIYSTVLTAAEVSADSEAMAKVTAYKNAGGSVVINGTTL